MQTTKSKVLLHGGTLAQHAQDSRFELSIKKINEHTLCHIKRKKKSNSRLFCRVSLKEAKNVFTAG